MTAPITAHDLTRDLRSLGLSEGDVVLLHSSLSAIGPVDGGARAVVDALLDVVGPAGTLVVPTFTPDVRDPYPEVPAATVDATVLAARAEVPPFDPDRTPTPMGAIPQAVLDHPDRLRSRHPQVSVAAIGAQAAHLCQGPEPLGYALDVDTPLGRLVDLGAKVLLLGVGHNRSSLLHHVETTVRPAELRRHKLRRFPMVIDGERVWVEVPDVGDDLGAHFPHLGAVFEQTSTTLRRGPVGTADALLLGAEEYVELTRPELTRRLAVATGWDVS